MGWRNWLKRKKITQNVKPENLTNGADFGSLWCAKLSI